MGLGGYLQSKLTGEELIVLPGIEGKIFAFTSNVSCGFLRVVQFSDFQMLTVTLATAFC